MWCCVLGCKNDSRNVTKSQGISFHLFPIDPGLRTAWLRAIGRSRWEPKEKHTICSEHFLKEDIYETSKGLRKVRNGAVPFILQFCRVCLAQDKKLIAMKKYKLEQAFENITGLSSLDHRLPRKLCVECAQRVLKFHQFRIQSLRANYLMLELVNNEERLINENLKKIEKEINNLSTSLSIKTIKPGEFDLIIYENDDAKTAEKTAIKSDGNEIFFNVFENDSKIVVDNGVTREQTYTETGDGVNEPVLKNEEDSGMFVDVFGDPKTDAESEDDNKDDVLHDHDYLDQDSSTDDELPRNVLRSRLQERRMEKEKTKVQKKTKKVKKEIDAEPKVDKRRKPFFNGDLKELLFTIKDMTYEEQVAEIEKRKESSNYKNGVFKCQECFKGFLDEDAYNSHMLRHTNACGEHRCSICKTHFKHSYSLRKHITAHHTQRFCCKQCPYTTTHRQSARLHERWHKGTKYTCPHCPDEFFKFTTYMGHVRIKHPSDFVCQLCGYSFVSEKGIQLHKRLKHRLESLQIPEDGPYCEPCNLRFSCAEALRRHASVSARHGPERAPNKPSKVKRNEGVSDKRAKGEAEQRRCTIRRFEGPIPCEQCGLQLEDSRAYHGHFRRMHPDKNRTNYPSMKSPCMCEVCGRIFQSYALLKDHRWVHTGERPFSCESCGKSFRMKQRLVAHRRVHSAEKASYHCAVCGKPFSTRSNRQRHMFIHTGLKPFKCEMCGKGFKHSSEKRAHVTYVHLKKPWPKRSRGKRRVDPRQVPMQAPSAVPPSDIGLQQLWPACDPKMHQDKSAYYAIKM